MEFNPIIIIGAPRSGTNILRDVISSLPDFTTWPCDEINYIWRHGNAHYSNDELPKENVNPSIKKFIRSKFKALSKKNSASFVVEKTCANSLRIPFVNKVLPEAKYIFIYRNGFDAIPSAMKRWSAKFEFKYIFNKAKFIPVSDMPFYSFSYLRNLFYKLLDKNSRLAFWGPKMKNYNKYLNTKSLEYLASMQWKECIKKSIKDLKNIPKENVFYISYEEFVERPEKTLKDILKFLNVDIKNSEIKKSISEVKTDSIGKGKIGLSEIQINLLKKIINDQQILLGYRDF
tara:strand:+ start:210 stop:1073 length:864 start_codon:yes stop_codon:yes gene_type:complete